MPQVALGFHDVVEDFTGIRPVDTVYTVDRAGLRGHLNAIAGVPGAGAVTTFEHGVPQQGVLLTFDDGKAGCYRCAVPELEIRNWRGYFFIITDCIGRQGFLGRAHILDLHRRGHIVGSHSVTHPERMSHIRWDQLVKEWTESCAVLSDITGKPVTVASVPGGYTSRRVCRAAAASGIRVLFTSEPTISVATIDGCLVLGRYSIRRGTSPSASGALASGARLPRYQESAFWLAKKVVKQFGGEWYIRTRRVFVGSPVKQPAKQVER
jgi:peptidoglycan/xylan/chitin deacetylase (PgdA/CDA1 family)